jgi:hypothetical protein
MPPDDLEEGYSSAGDSEPLDPFGRLIATRSMIGREANGRALRYAAEYKHWDEPLRDLVKRKGGINECAARFARRLGRGSTHAGAAGRLRQGGWPSHRAR